MKISFCVTYYNQDKYVEDSLRSILYIAKNIDFEILVGDDGSQDNTIEEIKKFQVLLGEKLKIYMMHRDDSIKNNPIYRASNNRLNLVKHATGDYIMFLDGDDYYCDKDFLIQAIEKLKNYSELVAVGFRYKNIFSDGEEAQKIELNQGFIEVNDYIRRIYINAGAFVFRNVFQDKYDLLFRNGFFDDNLITIFALQYGKMYYFDRVIYAYRQLNHSTWNSYDDLQKNLINVFDIEYISNVAPSFRRIVFVRNFGAIKFLFYRRKGLSQLLEGTRYKKFKDDFCMSEKSYICKILNYDNLCIFDKIDLVTWFYYHKISIKFLL